MRMFLLSGAAAFALTASPGVLLAQSATGTGTMQSPSGSTAPMPPSAPGTMPPAAGGAATSMRTAEQNSAYSGWPSDRQRDFDTLPPEQQAYFWTLQPQEQEGFWALTPGQRGRLYNMSPEQRVLAWQSIIQQLHGMVPTTPPGQANPPGRGIPTAGVPNPQDANQAARPAMPADESYQGGPYKGALTPPPAPAMNKDYPVCSRTVQDSCRNPGSM